MTSPQFDWKALSPMKREELLHALAAWVDWLQQTYETWVKLPPCWPEHEALRAELMFFKVMHEEAMHSQGGYEGVNWHAMMRNAAQQWEQLASCKHEVRAWRTGRGADYDQRLKQHLKQAIEASVKAGPGPAPAIRRPHQY